MALKIILPLLFFSTATALCQTQFKIRTFAFYNIENLFDTENDSLTFDDDRTPEGKDHWTPERFHQKITNIAKVLSEIGADVTRTSPDLIGLCEVENSEVLECLVNHPYLQDKHYGIIHFDSPDERGIDVALLYKKEAFLPIFFRSHRLLLFNIEGERDFTRDQLVVSGLLDTEYIHIIVNHWPSRSGGEARSKPNRLAAAQLNKRIIDSITATDPESKIIGMGDLNDDPISDSLKKVLKTKGNKRSLTESDLFNPMEKLFKKGVGTLAYRDHWNLFDQIFMTANLVDPNSQEYRFWKAGIFKPPYLVTQSGPYKGYPFRTYSAGNYTGGYSDHFPVYIYLVKAAPVKSNIRN
ncbi:MAG: endonuclease/exonuclease/phosphatase family protein [Maribacter sp.]|nr:endonuclease/exonuclease/phosphatase family protein [Maribacter sp.]